MIFEQYFRLHKNGSNMVISVTTSDSVFVFNSASTTKDQYFQVAFEEAMDACNAVLLNFRCTQNLESYNPKTHHVNPPLQHPLY